MDRERLEGVFVESTSVSGLCLRCPSTVCLLHFLQTSFEFAELAPHLRVICAPLHPKFPTLIGALSFLMPLISDN